MEVEGGDEIGLAAEAAGRVLHPLNLGVDRFAGGVRNPVPKVRDDILNAA